MCIEIQGILFNKGVIIMKNKGQNIIEFVIILALVIIGAILFLTLLGGNVTSMFSKSNEEVSNYKPFDWKAPNNTTAQNNNSSPVVSTENIDGQQVSFHQDGSVSFIAGNQNVSLSKNIVDLQNTVTEATGASGVKDLIDIVGYMIEKHQGDFPNQDVPVEVRFGKGFRKDAGGGNLYIGDASVNITTVMVGSHFMILQNDQTGPEKSEYLGKYTIEGDTGNNSSFSVNRLDGDKSQASSLSNATIDNTNGKLLINSNWNTTKGAGSDVTLTDGTTYHVDDHSWVFDFPATKYNL